jgi:hypothetical protein
VVASGTRSPSPIPSRPPERAAVHDLEFRLLVRKPVKRLQHQDFEHQNRVDRRPSAFRPVRPPQHRIELRPEDLEIHHRSKSHQGIAHLRQGCIPFIQIEQAPLIRQPSPPALLAPQ